MVSTLNVFSNNCKTQLRLFWFNTFQNHKFLLNECACQFFLWEFEMQIGQLRKNIDYKKMCVKKRPICAFVTKY